MHKLIRLAHQQKAAWVVETPEPYREHEAAQLAFALADYEERVDSKHPE